MAGGPWLERVLAHASAGMTPAEMERRAQVSSLTVEKNTALCVFLIDTTLKVDTYLYN